MSMAASMTAVRRSLIVPLAVAFIHASSPHVEDASTEAADRCWAANRPVAMPVTSCYCLPGRPSPRSPAFMLRSRAGTSKTSRTAALPAMWMALLSPGPETPVEEAAIPYGTSAARPTIAPADATRSHHDLDFNTPHAARVNNARLTSAPTLASVHAAPPEGFLVPANDAVIHRNVLAYTSSVAAATFRRVQRLRQPRVSARSRFEERSPGG